MWTLEHAQHGLSRVGADHWLRTRPIAHRGLHDGNASVPENSLAAFVAAMMTGCPIELDVHACGDGTLVACHDTHLLRLTGHDSMLGDMTYEAVCGLRLCGTSEYIPSLAQVFALVNGAVPLLIDIKDSVYPAQLAVLASMVHAYESDDIAVQSFDPYVMGWFALYAPQILRGQLACAFDNDAVLAPHERWLRQHYMLNHISQPDFIGHDVTDLPTMASVLMRRWGWPVLAWTVRDAQRAHAAQYADNIIFEIT